MKDTVCITSIYQEFWGTKEFRKSCKSVDIPVFNAWPKKTKKFSGNGDVFGYIYNALLFLKKRYKFAIYSDGADSYFVKSFTPPEGRIIYSAEKAYYPFYDDERNLSHLYKDKKSEWCYLNGGGYCGEIKMLIEYFEKTRLKDYKGDVNGQHEQHKAFFDALRIGFPVELDQDCRYFQTLAFADDKEIVVDESGIYNSKTETRPCLFHGNGRTDMTWLYNLYK